MTFSRFYRGFLYALCEADERGTFEVEGEAFHGAFGEALESGVRELPEAPIEELARHYDPVFGRYPGATEMVFEGERDFILALLYPRYRIARFRIDGGEGEGGAQQADEPGGLSACSREVSGGLESPSKRRVLRRLCPFWGSRCSGEAVKRPSGCGSSWSVLAQDVEEASQALRADPGNSSSRVGRQRGLTV
jgi:hypothetical protein